jgi:hypothetical protein
MIILHRQYDRKNLKHDGPLTTAEVSSPKIEISLIKSSIFRQALLVIKYSVYGWGDRPDENHFQYQFIAKMIMDIVDLKPDLNQTYEEFQQVAETASRTLREMPMTMSSEPAFDKREIIAIIKSEINREWP